MTAPIQSPVPTPDGGPGNLGELMNMDGPSLLAWVGAPEPSAPEAPPAAAPVPEPTETPRDEQGRFVKKDEAPVLPKMESTKTETPQETPAPQATETPATDKKADTPPLTAFTVRDGEGEIDPASLKDVMIGLKVKGQMVEEPLEKVVLRAQQQTFDAQQVSRLGEDRKNLHQQNQALQEAYQQAVADSREMAARLRDILLDESGDRFIKAQEALRAAESPEAKLARAERELQQVRAETAQRELVATASSWLEGEVAPLVESLVTEFPFVSPVELSSLIMAQIPQFQDRTGIVPPSLYPAFKAHLDTELRRYAEEQHTARSSKVTQREAELETARRKLQADQRRIGRALMPTGQPPVESSKATPITSARDALSKDAINEIIAATVRQR